MKGCGEAPGNMAVLNHVSERPELILMQKWWTMSCCLLLNHSLTVNAETVITVM